jgi:hypothetical protein
MPPPVGLPRPSPGCRLGPPAAGSTMPRPPRRGQGRQAGLCTSACTSTRKAPFHPRNPGLAVRLQIRHRRFDSDRSLSALDPCELPELPGFAGVFSFLGPAAPKSRQPAKLPQSATPSPLGPAVCVHPCVHRRRSIPACHPCPWLASPAARAGSAAGAATRQLPRPLPPHRAGSKAREVWQLPGKTRPRLSGLGPV